MKNLVMSLCVILVGLLSVSVYGTGIRKIYLPQTNLIVKPSSIQEDKFTLSGGILPNPYDPVVFSYNLQAFHRNAKVKTVKHILTDMLRTDTVFTLFQTRHFDDSMASLESSGEGKGESLVIPYSLGNSIDEIRASVEKQNFSHDMRFLIFTHFLYDQKISDEDVLKLFDSINLPKDFIFTGKSLNILENHSENFLIDFYFKNQSGSLNKEEQKNLKINLDIVRRFLMDKKMMDKYFLTTPSHEISASFRVELIEQMIQQGKLNFKVKDDIGNTFLHVLGSNKHLKKENWINIITHLAEDASVDFDMKNEEGFTFLTVLTSSGFKEPLEYLVNLRGGGRYFYQRYLQSFSFADSSRKFKIQYSFLSL